MVAIQNEVKLCSLCLLGQTPTTGRNYDHYHSTASFWMFNTAITTGSPVLQSLRTNIWELATMRLRDLLRCWNKFLTNCSVLLLLGEFLLHVVSVRIVRISVMKHQQRHTEVESPPKFVRHIQTHPSHLRNVETELGFLYLCIQYCVPSFLPPWILIYIY